MKTFFGDRYFWSDSQQPGIEVLQLLGSLDFSTALIVTDANVSAEWLSTGSLDERIRAKKWAGGEESKTLAGVESFIDAHDSWLDKSSVVVIAGGGSMLDTLGLCCGLIYRGIRYVSVPTSLIALSDAAYGGKTAVNYGTKNQIGLYHHPTMVYANPYFLETLADSHMRSGMIEIVKLGVFFPDVRASVAEVRSGSGAIADAAKLAAQRKLELLADDPYEDAEASVLLYGHPFGNVFEHFANDGQAERLPHGAAVAMGISLSAWVSDRIVGSGNRAVEQLRAVCEWVNPRMLVREFAPSVNHFAALLRRDKYSALDMVKIPAICDSVGFTTVALTEIAEHYEEWLEWLTSDETAAAVADVSSGISV